MLGVVIWSEMVWRSIYKDENMKHILLFAGLLMLGGCSSSAYPNLYGGNYYMMGDSNCQYVRPLSETRVMCMDEDQNDTGYRDAMTYDDMRMYQAQVEMYNAQMASLGQTLESVGQSVGGSTQPTYQYVPMEQPSLSYGSGNTTYRRVGNTIIGSDGTKCQIVGSNMICN